MSTSMLITYLCTKCSKLLNLKGFDAVNEVGRKYCEGCGDNNNNLIVVDNYKCMDAISKYNKENNE